MQGTAACPDAVAAVVACSRGGQPAQPGAGAAQGGAFFKLGQGGAVEQADPGRWGVVAVRAGDQPAAPTVLAGRGQVGCLTGGLNDRG